MCVKHPYLYKIAFSKLELFDKTELLEKKFDN